MSKDIRSALAAGFYLLACLAAVPATIDFMVAMRTLYGHPWPMYAIAGAVAAFLLLFSIASSLLALLCSEPRR